MLQDTEPAASWKKASWHSEPFANRSTHGVAEDLMLHAGYVWKCVGVLLVKALLPSLSLAPSLSSSTVTTHYLPDRNPVWWHWKWILVLGKIPDQKYASIHEKHPPVCFVGFFLFPLHLTQQFWLYYDVIQWLWVRNSHFCAFLNTTDIVIVYIRREKQSYTEQHG